jgi:DNA-binding transcriptional LysR family regulator
MDRVQAMQVFARVAELGSFTRAADDLLLPRATVTKLVRALETRLGARLLQRTTRSVRLTTDGEAYYERCVRLLADFEETESAFSHAIASPSGRLRVDLPPSIGRLIVVPRLPGFLARYPEIELELGFADRQVDLVREGVDCVLRAGESGDTTLVARPIGQLEQLTCAADSYLARFGEPESIADLAAHRAVNYVSASSGRVLDFEFMVGGERRLVPVKSAIALNNADAYVAAAEAGIGLIQAPRYHVAEGLASGRLREVLPMCRPPSMPLAVLYPHRRHLSRRLRVFVDWLVEAMQPVCGQAPGRP